MRTRWSVGDLVRVDWTDACAHAGWHTVDDVQEQMENGQGTQVTSVGVVSAFDRRFIAVSGSVGHDGELNGTMLIPRCWLVDVLVLERGLIGLAGE